MEASPAACAPPRAGDGAELAPILYAKAGGPPDDWYGLRIFDLDTSEEVRDVIEVNVVAGWVDHYLRNAAGDLYLTADQTEAAKRRWFGRFEIRRPTL